MTCGAWRARPCAHGRDRRDAADDWPAVREVYAEGIATGQATFEERPPPWEEWDREHLRECRLVARRDGRVVAWAALAPGVAPARVPRRGRGEHVRGGRRARGRGGAGARRGAGRGRRSAPGIWTLEGWIFPENEASLALCESFGCRVVGVRERLGQDGGPVARRAAGRAPQPRHDLRSCAPPARRPRRASAAARRRRRSPRGARSTPCPGSAASPGSAAAARRARACGTATLRELAAGERPPRHERDALALADPDLVARRSRCLRLKRFCTETIGAVRARALELVAEHVRDADLADLALVPQLGQRSDATPRSGRRVGHVELVQVDRVDAQAPQAALARFPQVLGSAVGGRLCRRPASGRPWSRSPGLRDRDAAPRRSPPRCCRRRRPCRSGSRRARARARSSGPVVVRVLDEARRRSRSG